MKKTVLTHKNTAGDFCLKTIPVRRQWEKNQNKTFQPRSVHPAKILLKTTGEIQSISDKSWRMHHHQRFTADSYRRPSGRREWCQK
jgi:hypothetical protein